MNVSAKLKVVIRHEYTTIIKQPSFWIVLIAIPALIGLIGLFSYISDRSDNKELSTTNAQSLKVSVVDNSGLLNDDIAQSAKVTVAPADQTQRLISEVQNGTIDGLIVYPSNITQSGRFQAYADNSKSDVNGTVKALGSGLLQRSLLTPIESDNLQRLALNGAQADTTSYRNGEVARTIPEMILPGLFLVLFYIVLVFSVSYALTSVSDEKENRSIEMILSYVKPQTLILGKLIAIILVTLTQILYFAILGLAAYGIFKALGNDISLPINISDLSIDTSTLLFGIGFLVLGFVFFVGLMATIGAIFPSTKDASSFSTIFFLLPAIPFWLFSTITSQSDSFLTKALTQFPLTSPTTGLIRNTFGTLPTGEAISSLLILAVSTVAIVLLAGRAFKLGTLEFNSRVSIKSLFGRS